MDILIGDEWNDTLDDSVAGNDSDIACGFGGAYDVIDVRDGDGLDDVWDFSGAAISKDAWDTVHTSGDECP